MAMTIDSTPMDVLLAVTHDPTWSHHDVTAKLELLGVQGLELLRNTPIVVGRTTSGNLPRIRAVPGVQAALIPEDPSYIEMLQTFDTFAGQPAAEADSDLVRNISISYGPGRFDPYEPLNVATKAATDAGHVFVFASGNDGARGEGTLSRWSVAPWVIGVVASDQAGTRLWPHSSVGWPGDKIHHPTVVAPGENIPVPANLPLSAHANRVMAVMLDWTPKAGEVAKYESGSSLATPLVSRICGITMRWFGALQFVVEHIEAGMVKPEKGWPIFDLLSVLRRYGIEWQIRVTPALVKQILIDMARPMPGHAPYQVGAGFVDEQVAASYLKRFSGSRFVRFFAESPIKAKVFAEIEGTFETLLPPERTDAVVVYVRQKLSLVNYDVFRF
jgi:hypothetical protein